MLQWCNWRDTLRLRRSAWNDGLLGSNPTCSTNLVLGRIFSGQIRPRLCEIPPPCGECQIFPCQLFSARSKGCNWPCKPSILCDCSSVGRAAGWMRVDGSSPSNRTRVPVFLGCYSTGTFHLILVIPGSFDMMLRSISYRKQQGFVSRVYMQRSYNGECASLPSWRCGFDSHSLLHAARQDSFAH